jgi:hypothetical protein
LNDVVVHELKPRVAFQVLQVAEMAGEEIVEADHLVSGRDERFTEMRAEETSAAGDE